MTETAGQFLAEAKRARRFQAGMEGESSAAPGLDGGSSGSSLRWRKLSGARLGWRELGYSRLGWKEVVGSNLQSIMQSQTWLDAAPGSRELRELVGFRLALRELGDFSLR